MAFTTIYVTPGLPRAQRRRAQRCGPRAVGTRSDQPRLLASAGFIDIDAVDLTTEFAGTVRAWLAAYEANQAELVALESPGAFEQRQRERRAQLRAIDDGLLRRGLFSAARRATVTGRPGSRR
jgi:hypothetical protein